LGCPDCHGPIEDDQHLLVGVVEVIGEGLLARAEDVDAGTEHLATETPRQPYPIPFVARMVLVGIPFVGVDVLHRAEPTVVRNRV
jgi:hypothetical protein